jgi:hypothetical protein
MTNGSSLMLAFVVIVAVLGALMYLLVVRSQRMNFTNSRLSDEKPESVASTLLSETIIPPQLDVQGSDQLDAEFSERLASPFAEQIEDIVKALIAADPQLVGTKVDFGTAPDGRLEIWVGDKRYADIAHLPDERLRELMQQAVARFKESDTKS